MERKDVALGKAAEAGVGVGVVVKPVTVEERVASLEAKMELLIKLLPARN